MYEEGLKKTGRNIVLAIFAIIVGILTFLSMFLNTYISIEERSTIIEDNPYKMIIYFIVVLVALFFVRRFYKLQKKIDNRKMFIRICLVLLAIFTIIIFTHNIYPVADQQEILNCATALKQGNYAPFLPDGYVGKCTNQAGIVMILYYLSFIFGDNNYHVFQFLNVLGLILSYYCICKISMISFSNDEIEQWTFGFLILFLPLTWYVTFVYGNIFGHAFSMQFYQDINILRIEKQKISCLVLDL